MATFNPTIINKIGRTKLTLRQFCERAGVSEFTIYTALKNPNRNIRSKTIWSVVDTYATLMDITPDQAYQELIVESDETRTPLAA